MVRFVRELVMQFMRGIHLMQPAIQLASLTVPCPGYAVQIIHMGLHGVHVWLQNSAQTHSTPALPTWLRSQQEVVNNVDAQASKPSTNQSIRMVVFCK
jgi:hypothetical protein